MTVISFNFTKINAEKIKGIKGKLNISNNVSIKAVNSFDLKLGNENIIYPNSPISSSTGIGYLVEAYIYKLLKNKNITAEKNTNQSFYDLRYNYNNKIELFVAMSSI